LPWNLLKLKEGEFMKRLATLMIVAAGVAASGVVMAQSADRAGSWEARTALTFENSATWDFEGGTEARIENDLGFVLGFAYHLNDNLEFGGGLEFGQQDYTADIASGTFPGTVFSVDGELESFRLMLDGTYNFLPGKFSPFVTGGIGWSWVDTNIATQPPQTGCWWDPWWGYICTSYQNTKSIDGLTYRLGVGMRYDISDSLAIHAAYRMTWIDLDNAEGTPDQDGFLLGIGWKF
jgi:opacity protein-like surface antigen